MKRDELPLSDDPVNPGPSADQHADTSRAQRMGAQDLLDDIAEMLDDTRRFGWATSTLEGIAETVERIGYATDGQRRAIQNIRGARGR